MKKMNKSQEMPRVSAQALSVLGAGFLIVFLQLGYIAFDIFSGSAYEQLSAVLLYRRCFDYILLEIVILIGGAFLFDLVAKDVTIES